MTNYSVVTGDGNELCSGVSEHEIERVAQSCADHLAETVYYSEMGGADLDPDDDEDIGIAVKPTTVRCECGECTGVRCKWIGSPDETVTVEYMPEQYRASHEAAGNRGVYPHNGAIRVQCERSCAESLVEDAGDWASIVGEPT